MITMRLKTVLTVCLLILLFSCHEERTERSEKTTLMRLSAIEGIQHPHMKAAEYLAKLIERRSGNRMRIQVRSSSAEESIENLLKQLMGAARLREHEAGFPHYIFSDKP